MQGRLTLPSSGPSVTIVDGARCGGLSQRPITRLTGWGSSSVLSGVHCPKQWGAG